MAVALEWTFDKDLSGFVKNQQVKLSREQIERDHYLICQAQQIKSTPGVKLTDIVLPNNGSEYCIEIDGFANNTKSFIWVVNEHRQRLIKEYVVLPELMGTEQKIKPTCATFRLNDLNTQKDYCTISIGVLIGGSEPSTNDIFFIKKIKLYDKALSHNNSKTNTHTEGIQVTRIYQNIDELELDLPNPSRDNPRSCNPGNASSMCPGEYALIKCDEEGVSGGHGKLFVAYSDPELGSAVNLKYVCNITGKDNIFSQGLNLEEKQIIPIYDDETKAWEDVKDKATAEQFYNLNARDTQRQDQISGKDGKVFLYFDKEGYIRWMNSQKSNLKKNDDMQEVQETQEIGEIEVSESLIERLKNVAGKASPVASGTSTIDGTLSHDESEKDSDVEESEEDSEMDPKRTEKASERASKKTAEASEMDSQRTSNKSFRNNTKSSPTSSRFLETSEEKYSASTRNHIESLRRINNSSPLSSLTSFSTSFSGFRKQTS